MSNPEHVDLLKQGVDVWNKWRRENPGIEVDFSGANFSDMDLSMGNFSQVRVKKTPINTIPVVSYVGLELAQTQWNNAHLHGADFNHANLRGAHFRGAYLAGTNFSQANLSEADLSFAMVHSTNFSWSKLTNVAFTSAEIYWASFSHSDLTGVDMSQALMAWNTFVRVGLETIKGLDTVTHDAPSSVDMYTILLSKGKVPESFLQGIGLPQSILEYSSSLLTTPIQYYTCFIAYSHHNEDFAKRLHADLQAREVRCWFADEDLKIGDHYHQRIDESIRLYDKLVLILSEHAVQSTWVEREVGAAREKEERQHKPVLFPIRIDDTVMDTTKAWAADVRRGWHIGDFTQWKDHDHYQQTFDRLLHDLNKDE